MNQDLFGNEIEAKAEPLENELAAYDENTFEERLERLKYLHQVYPEDYGFLMSVEMHYLFNEARRAFINGEFIGTILLAQSFIEHWLQSKLEAKGFVFSRSKQGLNYILTCLRDGRLMHEFLIDKIDQLRKMRNPFVHVRPFDDPHNIVERSYKLGKIPDMVLENDAKDALSLMYQVAITRV
jgi:hypothetical protein